MTTPAYDIVIIGSGMGGLVCGDILTREGYRVCILEKNKQIGGCLQTYVRDREIFDAGVHYLGGLDKGQNLYQVFQYLGIMKDLKLERMDMDGFDRILTDDGIEYPYAQGYENFIRQLLRYFPAEEHALRRYCEAVKAVCQCFPLYNLRSGGRYDEKAGVMDIDTRGFLESLTDDKKLQAVLAGNNFLYAGQPDKTPFYVHAMILNSYIESAWKCVKGGSQIGKLLARNIRSRGSVIRRNAKVVRFEMDGAKVAAALLEDGSLIAAKQFISNLHPANTLALTDTDMFKNVFRRRINSLENSVSVFMINIVFKERSFPYFRHNYYYFRDGHVWDMAAYTDDDWPLGYGLFLTANANDTGYATSMTILTYMRFDEVAHWAESFNTVAAENERSTSYQAFKTYKAKLLLEKVEEKFPGLSNHIASYYTATPLSYRDYIGTNDGSMYGIVKDYRDPMKTFIAARTRVPNLFLTGQNLNLHGVLGATMSALVTCTEILGNEDVIDKIKQA